MKMERLSVGHWLPKLENTAQTYTTEKRKSKGGKVVANGRLAMHGTSRAISLLGAAIDASRVLDAIPALISTIAQGVANHVQDWRGQKHLTAQYVAQTKSSVDVAGGRVALNVLHAINPWAAGPAQGEGAIYTTALAQTKEIYNNAQNVHPYLRFLSTRVATVVNVAIMALATAFEAAIGAANLLASVTWIGRTEETDQNFYRSVAAISHFAVFTVESVGRLVYADQTVKVSKKSSSFVWTLLKPVTGTYWAVTTGFGMWGSAPQKA